MTEEEKRRLRVVLAAKGKTRNDLIYAIRAKGYKLNAPKLSCLIKYGVGTDNDAILWKQLWKQIAEWEADVK